MIAKLATVFIIFGLGSKAFELPFGLDETIQQGKEKIWGLSKQSDKEISSTEKYSAEYKEFFDKSVSAYLSNGDSLRQNLTIQLNEMTKKYIGEAVDKNKNPNTFECIVKAKAEADTTITNSKNSAYQCASDVYNKQMKELESVDVQIFYIRASTAGLYQELTASLDICKDENGVKKLIQAGETRLNSLKKVLQSFNDKLLVIRAQFNQNQDNCLRNSHNGNLNAFKAAENKMKFC